MGLTVKVLLFASAREAVGNISEMTLTFDCDSATTANFRKLMAEKYPKLSTFVLDEESITLALNEEYVQSGQVLSLADGDTVALIPPISGG